MIRHLIRPRFIDRWWDAADLDAAAELWLRLYEEAARVQGFAATPTHRTEIRLRGFPRAEADALLRELAARVAASDFPAPEADRPEPDMLVIASGELRGEEQPPAGLGLPVLAAPAFDGLMAEMRFEVVGDEGKSLRKVQLESTLVLVGEIRGGRFLLKAAWRAGSHGWEDKLCWNAPWQDEEKWLAALAAFRESAEVPTPLAKKLFQSRGNDKTGGRAVGLIHVPLDAPRLGGLVTRAFGFAAALVVLGLGGWWAYSHKDWILLLPLVFALWPVLMLLYFFVKGEWRLWNFGFYRFRDGYARIYTEAIQHLPLTRAEADARLNVPWARKFTADLEAAGFRYLGDMRLEPARAVGDGVFRAFAAPDGLSYLTVFFHLGTAEDQEPRFKNWPAAVAFLGHTYFADGGYATSVSGRSLGYRKKRTGPEHLARVFRDADDPAEFARRHADAAAKFGAETGRRPVAHQTFEHYLRRQKELSDDERRLFADNPYTRGDHLHWYLQWPRKEYVG